MEKIRYKARKIYFNLIIGTFFISGYFFIACSSNEKKMDPYELCFEFYELNKNKNLDGLLNLLILTIREKSEYDEKIHKNIRIPAVIGIDDSVSMENIKLPSFKKNADLPEKKYFFHVFLKKVLIIYKISMGSLLIALYCLISM